MAFNFGVLISTETLTKPFKYARHRYKCKKLNLCHKCGRYLENFRNCPTCDVIEDEREKYQRENFKKIEESND